MDFVNQLALAKAAGKATVSPSKSFAFNKQNMSAQALNTAFMKELRELGKTPHEFERNKETIFELLETNLSEVIPAKVLAEYGQFADIQRFAQGTLPVFRVRISEASRLRAKQFVTKVGAAGRYEVFKLDGYKLEVPTSAYGGASRIEWEEMLDNRWTMNDFYNIVLEGMDERVYREIANALVAMVKSIKPVNKVVQTGFNDNQMVRLLQTADAYGQSTIYCTFEFASTMIPDVSWASDAMKQERWNNGYFTTYKGHNVIVLPQSFEDATNTKKVIDPSFAFILPAGTEKPVKVAFEGNTQVKSFENRDWSTEIQTYQKVGIATYLINPGICVYQNTGLSIDNK